MGYFQSKITLYIFNIAGSSSPIETTTPLTPLPVTTTTKEPTFQCQYYEIPLELRCDGIPHCMPGNEDEQNCPEGNIQPCFSQD